MCCTELAFRLFFLFIILPLRCPLNLRRSLLRSYFKPEYVLTQNVCDTMVSWCVNDRLTSAYPATHVTRRSGSRVQLIYEHIFINHNVTPWPLDNSVKWHRETYGNFCVKYASGFKLAKNKEKGFKEKLLNAGKKEKQMHPNTILNFFS